MKQSVVITRLADRHDDLHERRFAETCFACVPAGHLHDVVGAALAEVGELPRGSYVIRVDWPHE